MTTFAVEGVRYYDQYRKYNSVIVDGQLIGPPIPNDGTGNWIDLDYCYNITNGFFDAMKAGGAVNQFYWAGADAWETDIRARENGGDDENWADTVDVYLFAGHSWNSVPDGQGGTLAFNSAHNDWTSPTTAWSLGDRWLNWLALYTCDTLKYRDRIWDNYANILDGLHLMLASWGDMHFGSENANMGRAFAHNLMDGDPVWRAWFDAVGTDNSPAAISPEVETTWNNGNPLYEQTNLMNDHLYGKGVTTPTVWASSMAWICYRWRHHK